VRPRRKCPLAVIAIAGRYSMLMRGSYRSHRHQAFHQERATRCDGGARRDSGAGQGATPMIPYQTALALTCDAGGANVAALGRPRPRVAAGFASHHNASAVELLRALAEKFPTIVRMLGEEAFISIAARFVAQEAPTALAETFYGDRFPAFLRQV